MTDPKFGPTPTSQGVRGYRNLTQPEIEAINTTKMLEEEVATWWGKIDRMPASNSRWLEIARTHFQEGFSALIRSIAQPADPFQAAFTNNQQDEIEHVIPPKHDGGARYERR